MRLPTTTRSVFRCFDRATAAWFAVVPILVGLSISPGRAAAQASPSGGASSDASAGAASSPYDVTVRERRPTTAASSLTVRSRDFELRPINSPGELLRVVPGLFTGQHAGGGKADQLLLRGFDADHGTDVAVSVDGLPVNMRSHAHGQGYADLHFVIPETIERVEVFKGPYFAEFGDFATGGAVNLVPRSFVAESLAKVEVGEFNTKRVVAVVSPRMGPFGDRDAPLSLVAAFEGHFSDGPFESPQNMDRLLGNLRLTANLSGTQRLTGFAGLYNADWNASGQVPQRATDADLIDRFGSIDDSEGGDTGRLDFLVRHEWTPSSEQTLRTSVWAVRYDLDLFSDFTFRLDDSANGDGIYQQDDRWVYGSEIVYRQAIDIGLPMAFSTGFQSRTDDAHVVLGKQTQRTFTEATRDSNIQETSLALFAQDEIFLTPWVRTVLGMRGEAFFFEVDDNLGGDEQPEGQKRDFLLLPKANLIVQPFADAAPLASTWQPLRDLDLYANYGQGYHSNDARDVLCNHSGTPDDGCNPRSSTLPRAVGYEIGIRTRLFDRLDLALAHFWLNLERELVFVGDAGETESRPRSRRRGIEFEARAQLLEWLSTDLDLTYTRAEFSHIGAVPQAPRFTASTGITVRHGSGISADLRMRSLGRRYAVEDRGTTLHGYAVADVAVRYRWKGLEASLAVENFTNEQWRSAEFFFESQLPGEAVSAEDFHFTPGNPRNFRVGLAWHF